jgi:hypothetical protein
MLALAKAIVQFQSQQFAQQGRAVGGGHQVEELLQQRLQGGLGSEGV